MEFVLHVRNVAERDGDGIGNVVADADSVQRGGEFTGICGDHEGEDRRRNGEVFDHDIEEVEQLLLRQVIAREQVGDHGAGAVNFTALVRREQENCGQIQHHEDHDEIKN